MNDILAHRLKRHRPQTQEDCVAIGVRQSLARLGAFTDPGEVSAACYGMARGLFGPAFIAADLPQKLAWYKMTKRQYEIATK